MTMTQVIASDPAGAPIMLSEGDFHSFGCPICGGKKGIATVVNGSIAQFICRNCGQTTWIVAGDVEHSATGLGFGNPEPIRLKVTCHYVKVNPSTTIPP